jgi:hypothetical protein
MHLIIDITSVTKFFDLIDFSADNAASQRHEILKIYKIPRSLFVILVKSFFSEIQKESTDMSWNYDLQVIPKEISIKPSFM